MQYAFKLRVDIIDSNSLMLYEDGLKLAKLDSSSDATTVYKIVDLGKPADVKAEKQTATVDLFDLNDSIDVEFLEAGEIAEDEEAEVLQYNAEEDEDSPLYERLNETLPKEAQEAKDDTDDDQDAVSFLLDNSHLLNKIGEESEKSPAPSKTKSSQRRPHSCQVCKRTFLRKSNLVDHLRLHANLRLYQCKVCDKSFVQAGNFKSHMRIHTKERPFVCTMCPKTYNQSSALKVSAGSE